MQHFWNFLHECYDKQNRKENKHIIYLILNRLMKLLEKSHLFLHLLKSEQFQSWYACIKNRNDNKMFN